MALEGPDPRGLGRGLARGAAALASAVSPLSAFNILAPRDRAVRLGRGLAYGPDPMQAVDVFAPAGGVQRAPVLIFFHGGGWDSGRRQDYGFVGRAFAACGFLSLVAGYRLTPAVRYPAFVEDAADVVLWARDNAAAYGGDPERVVLVGHSAGAYIAVMVALDLDFLRARGLDPGLIRGVAGLSGPYDFLPLAHRSTEAAFGAYPNLLATQPINHVRPGAPPLFLAHGAKDTLVGVRNSVRLGRAQAAVGEVAEVRIYPGLGHADTVLALSRPFRAKAPVLGDASAFLMAHALG